MRRAAPPALALSTRSSAASRNFELWSIICVRDRVRVRVRVGVRVGARVGVRVKV